jgi:hypothetical protein
LGSAFTVFVTAQIRSVGQKRTCVIIEYVVSWLGVEPRTPKTRSKISNDCITILDRVSRSLQAIIEFNFIAAWKCINPDVIIHSMGGCNLGGFPRPSQSSLGEVQSVN